MKYRHRVLALLFLLAVVTYLDRVCVSVAGPRIQADLRIPPEQWGWVMGAFTLAYSIFELPSGMMADRFGPRGVLTRIVLWWSTFTALTGAASSYTILLGTRFLFGAGEAGAFPSISATLSRWFPDSERARAMGFIWMATRLGGALSPLIVVPIQMRYGWRASFYLLGLAGLAWPMVWYRWFRDEPANMPAISPRELAEIGAGSGRGRHGLPWGLLLGSGNLWTIMAMYHAQGWGAAFYFSWMHTYLEKGRGFSEQEMKIFSTLPFLVGILGNLTGGYLSDLLTRRYGLKTGRRSVGALGMLISAGFLLATGLTATNSAAVVFLTLAHFGIDMMLPVGWSVCMDVGGPNSGAISGSMNMAGQAGSFLSSVAFGYIVKATGSYSAPLLPISGMLLLSALLFLRIDPTKRLNAAIE